MVSIQQMNSWSDAEAHAAFLRCCGSTCWAREMAARRPFADDAALMLAATEVWRGLSQTDWLEAFAAHPKIGDVATLRRKFAPTASWALHEQAGVAGAPEDVLQALAEGNRRYQDKFGYIFIVCATGKTAAEMLQLLEQRLGNDPATEFAVAAGQQEQITRIRLEKL